jgi:hypothetical protein
VIAALIYVIRSNAVQINDQHPAFFSLKDSATGFSDTRKTNQPAPLLLNVLKFVPVPGKTSKNPLSI